jgi:hypothetical protein
MNCDVSDDLTLPMFECHEKLAELERQLYGHIIEAIDWDALNHLEQFLFQLLCKRNIGQGLAIDIARQLIERSLQRAAYDQSDACESIPFGITDEERRAVAFDDDCPFCEFEVQLAKQQARDKATPREPAEDEPCPLCDDMAAEWREQNAEALAQAGLTPHTAHACSKETAPS